MMSVYPCAASSLMIAWPGCADPADHDLDVRGLFLHHPERVGQRGEHHDRGAVLVVVEHRDVQQVAQSALDLEAARGGDVLEIDPAVAGCDAPDDLHDHVGVLGVEHHRPGVDAAEVLEQRRFALHDGHGRGGPDVAEAENGSAVGDDRDGVALDGEPAGVGGIVGDRQADPRDARGVGAGEIVTMLERHLGHHFDLSAEVQQEGPVADLSDGHARKLGDRFADPVGMLGVRGVAGDVNDDAAGFGLHDVQGGQCAARTHHRSGEIGGRADGGRCLHPHGDRVARTGARHVISNFYLTE